MGDHFTIRWSKNWTPELDEALAQLPESPSCPHGALKAIIGAASATRKEIALVSRRGDPVAVVPIRRVGRRWEFVGQNVLARSAPPAQPGMLLPALRALGRDIECWGTTVRPPEGMVHDLRPDPVHVIHLQDDYEAYWREMKNHGAVRSARKRTRDLSILVDAPGAAEWIITNAHRAYGLAHQTADEIAAANWLGNHGAMHSVWLMSGSTPVSGATMHVYEPGSAAGMTFFSDPAFSWHQPGVRMIDYICEMFRDLGLLTFDLRGSTGFPYKVLWAPANESYWHYRVTPTSHRIATLAFRTARLAAYRWRAILPMAPKP